MAVDTRNRKVEEISRLEHELDKASISLKSSLEAMSSFESRMAKVEANLELRNMRCAKGANGEIEEEGGRAGEGHNGAEG